MVAMLASSVIPMLMQPEVRKGVGKLAKYLLIFGGLGVGILAFILISKKIDPLKAISGWLKKSVTGVQKELQKGVAGFQKDVAKGVTGFQKDVAKGVTGFQKDVAKGWMGFWGDIGKGISGFQKDVAKKLETQEQKRRQMRVVGKSLVRELESVRNLKGIAGKPISDRMLVVKAAFKSVDRKPLMRIEQQFDRAFRGSFRGAVR